MWKWVLVWSWWVRKVSRNEIQFIRVNSIICRILWKYIVLYFQYHRPIGQWNDLRIACRHLNTNLIKITWSNQVYRNQIYCNMNWHLLLSNTIIYCKIKNLYMTYFLRFSRSLGNILTRFSVVGLARFFELSTRERASIGRCIECWTNLRVMSLTRCPPTSLCLIINSRDNQRKVGSVSCKFDFKQVFWYFWRAIMDYLLVFCKFYNVRYRWI